MPSERNLILALPLELVNFDSGQLTDYKPYILLFELL